MNNNNERKPLVFTEARREMLEKYLSGFTYINRLKWNSNKSFVTFRIHEDAFKVVTAPNKSVDNTRIVYYSDRLKAEWVINAYYFHLSSPSIIKIIKTIGILRCKYETEEMYEKMNEIANKNNIDPKALKHKCFEKNGDLILDIPDSEMGKYNLLVNELTNKTIDELCIVSDRYGATYYIIKELAFTVFADALTGLSPDDDGFNVWSQLKNEYPVQY